jgi:superfamily II DNA or RNA helicase
MMKQSEPHLSVAAKLALEPWFNQEILEEGLVLLAGGQAELICHRQAAGVLFRGERNIFAHLCFERTDRISQGFRIIGPHCSACRRVPGKGGNCSHLAALAIAMLDRYRPEGEKLLPLPLTFQDTPWRGIGTFLFDHYQRQGTFRLVAETGGWRLQFRHHQLLLDCLLPASAAFQLQALFSRELGKEDQPQPAAAKEMAGLHRTLQEVSLTETEAALRRAGRESRGVERDCSLWLWLARFFAWNPEAATLGVKQSGEGEFSLVATGDTAASVPLFVLVLERQHVAGLLKALAAFLPQVIFLPPARQFFRVEIAGDGSLLVTPCLRLVDGRAFTRPELAGQRYRDHYYLAAEGFLPVAPLAKECELRPAAPDPPGLFDLAVRDAGLDLPFSIANREIPAFIDKNRQILANAENEVDPALLAGPCRERPDGLEFLAGEEDDHWLYLAGHYRIGSRRVSLVDLIEAGQQGLSYLPGIGLKLSGTGLDWFYRLGSERLWRQNGEITGIRLNRQELLRLSGMIGTLELPADAGGDRLRHLLHADSWQEPASLPECPEHLREYQRHGLAWLYHLYVYGLGGILADDMGLGKTHQALGLCWVLRRSGIRHRFLVVCPATVASHWAMKLERFYPELTWCLYHGQGRDLAGTADIDVVITTYGVLRQDGGVLAEIPFEAVIFDEMQQLKNKKTAVFQAASQLAGRVMIGLTGTPLENSVHDLKALFDLCLPGALGTDKEFARRYASPITEQGSSEKQEELARLLSSFFLRRDRRQVLKELPDIIDDIRTCELSADQVALYQEAIGKENAELVDRLADDSRQIPYMEILTLIGTLKQICNHPALLAAGTGAADGYASGKWDLFVELLAECLTAGMKVVIFSQYTRMLDIIERHLMAEGIEYCGLRGDMSLKARRKAINRFNDESTCRVFCASLLAGGTGIDLTAAQAVIHYDRWWNAAKEDQATARVHRLGQQRVVQVFKLVTIGTLEEKIHRLIEGKRDLAGQLIRADDAGMVKRLGREDLMELLRWQQ